jgi:F-box and leucine-rich repeat protein GRR1
MFNEADEGDQMGDVTTQTDGMVIDEMNDEEDYGNDSEMLGQD